jgi:hypothetical protein
VPITTNNNYSRRYLSVKIRGGAEQLRVVGVESGGESGEQLRVVGVESGGESGEQLRVVGVESGGESGEQLRVDKFGVAGGFN